MNIDRPPHSKWFDECDNVDSQRWGFDLLKLYDEKVSKKNQGPSG